MAHEALDQALRAVDGQTYIYTMRSLLPLTTACIEVINNDQLAAELDDTGLRDHRQILREFCDTEDSGQATDLTVFGGSVACMSLVKLPDSKRIAEGLRTIDESTFNSTLINYLVGARMSSEDDIMAHAERYFDAYPVLDASFQLLSRYEEFLKLPPDLETAITMGGVAINIALIDAVEATSPLR